VRRWSRSTSNPLAPSHRTEPATHDAVPVWPPVDATRNRWSVHPTLAAYGNRRGQADPVRTDQFDEDLAVPLFHSAEGRSAVRGRADDGEVHP
jgi:hypothetical protein